MGRKRTQEEFEAEAIAVHGDRYDYSKAIYIDALSKVEIICKIHGSFWPSVSRHLSGANCLECSKIQRGQTRTKMASVRFEEDARKVHGNKYDYSQVVYIKSSKNVNIICDVHGVFQQTPNTHLGGAGCNRCGVERNRDALAYTTDEFISQANDVHNSKYDYSLAEYKGWDSHVQIICNNHGRFSQRAGGHLNGAGCQQCATETIIRKLTRSTDEFIELAKKVHGDRYDYSLTKYTNCKNKVIIICHEHGPFEQMADGHLVGYGCGRCGGTKKLTTELFKERAIKVHGDTYLYDEVEYIRANKKVVITCRLHGNFKQTPNAHLSGNGCAKCNWISKAETDWLDFLSIPQEWRQIRLPVKVGRKKYITADAFDHNTKTIYEFYGDFWHGNPQIHNPKDMNLVSKKTFGQLYDQTIKREGALISMGYNIISIWENEWKQIRKNQ